MKNWIKQNKMNILVMAVYSICSFIILMLHESWRDEAQAWMIVRDLDFAGIIQQMKYEGHFLLWYIILIPFAKFGLPYISIKIVSWAIVNIAVWIIIKKSPFKLWVKIILIFSYPMLYLYPIIARSYCIIPLAISLIASNYKYRKTKPIKYVLSIILLANTHILMLGLVGMLLLTFFIEQIKERKQNTTQQNRRIIVSFILASILLVITIFPLLGSLETNAKVKLEDNVTIEHLIGLLKQNIIVTVMALNTYNVFLVSITLMFIYICAVYEIRHYLKNFVVIFFSIIYQFIIYEFLYNTSQQKANTILMIILLFVWIQRNEDINKNKKIMTEYNINCICIITVLFINCICGIADVIREIKYNYSSAEQTANFICENINEESIFISNNMPFTSSIIPYIKDFKIWNPQREEYFTYVVWDEENEKALNVDLMEKLEKNFSRNQQLYYIYADYNNAETQQILQLENEGKLVKIFESDKSISKEDYCIYKIFFEN